MTSILPPYGAMYTYSLFTDDYVNTINTLTQQVVLSAGSLAHYTESGVVRLQAASASQHRDLLIHPRWSADT